MPNTFLDLCHFYLHVIIILAMKVLSAMISPYHKMAYGLKVIYISMSTGIIISYDLIMGYLSPV